MIKKLPKPPCSGSHFTLVLVLVEDLTREIWIRKAAQWHMKPEILNFRGTELLRSAAYVGPIECAKSHFRWPSRLTCRSAPG